VILLLQWCSFILAAEEIQVNDKVATVEVLKVFPLCSSDFVFWNCCLQAPFVLYFNSLCFTAEHDCLKSKPEIHKEVCIVIWKV